MENERPTILAIDDNLDNLTTLKAVVADSFPGATVLTATNGPAGIEQALAADPDVILLDIVMPGMDGYEVCRRLKAEARMRHIPVVFLTATRSGAESRVKALDMGAEGFLTKPLEMAELTAQIRAMTKIKAAALLQLDERERLASLVAERTVALERELAQRRRTEETLCATEAHYRAVIHSANDAIISADGGGNVVGWNPAAERMFGFTETEILGRPVSLLAPFRYHEAHLAGIARLRSGGETHLMGKTVELAGRRKDGGEFPLELSLSEWQDSLDRLYVAVVRDVTERKQAEAVLLARLRLNAYASSHTLNELLQMTLDELEALTASQIGFFHFLDDDQKTISLRNWSSHTLQTMCAAEGRETHRNVDEAGVWSDCFHQRKAVIHNDYTGLPHRKGLPHGHVPVIREVTVPVMRNDRIVAILGVGNKATDYDSSDVEVVTLLADLAWDIAERKWSEGAVRQRVAELETINRVSIALRGATRTKEILTTVLEEALAALNSAHGGIALANQAAGRLHDTISRGWVAGLNGASIRPNEGILGRVFTDGETYISRDLVNDPGTPLHARAQLPVGWGGAFVPIRMGAQALGVLVVAVASTRALSGDEARLLDTLADMAGSALHRLRLSEETELRLANLQALGEVEQAISASFDLRLILDTVISQAIAQQGVDAADVLLLHPTLRTLEYAAGQGFRSRTVERTALRLGQPHAGLAALERRTIRVTGLAAADSAFARSPLVAGEDFVEYHAVPLISKSQVRGVLELFRRSPLHTTPDWLDFLETLAGQAAIAIENAQLFEGIQRSNLDLALAYDATIEGWSRALDMRDKETEGHTQRVTEMTMRLARNMGVSDAELVHVRRGALLHDIGKMGVPDGVLLKPGPLTEEEWVLMRRHPQLAYDLLAPITYLRPALDIPYCHHERMDGSGYPRGLAGEQIPLMARLFAVVDVWDALRNERPYRLGWTEEAALAHIRAGAGTHFDPKVVEVFLRGLEEE